MSSDFRKVALIAASLGLLLSLFLALRPGDDEEAAPTTSAATTTTPATTEAEPPATTTEASPTPTAILDVDARTGEVVRLTVDRGDRVVLNVTAAVVDHVHLHGYDLKADVSPARPAKISFTADVPGRFELELEESGIDFAELEVRP